MPSHLLLFIYFHVVLTSLNNHILLFVSLSDFNSRFYNPCPISIRYFIISNVSLSPVCVIICSTTSEKFSRDFTLEIRPLLSAGQTSPLQPHPEEEICCSSCVSLNSYVLIYKFLCHIYQIFVILSHVFLTCKMRIIIGTTS